MDLLIKSLSLLDDFLSQKSSTLLDKDYASKDNSQAIFQALQQLAGYENQLELADCIATKPKWIETIVSFAVTIFEGLTGSSQTGEKLGYCLQVAFGCLIHWSDKSKSFRTIMLKEGLIFENVHILNKLGSAIGNEFVSYLIIVNIAIIYNCAKEELFELYHSKITWYSLLQPWVRSTNVALKLHTIFLLGYLAPSLNQKDYAKMTSNWSEKDMNYVLDLLFSLSSSSDLTVSCDKMTFSAEEILSNVLNLIHFTKTCFAMVCQPKLIQPCVSLLQKGTDIVRCLTCQLLWELLLTTDDVSFRDFAILEPTLNGEIHSLSTSANVDVAEIANCLKTALQKHRVDPEHSLEYIKGCYAYKHYQVCLETIENIGNLAVGDDAAVFLQSIKGKALFHLYQKEKRYLERNASSMQLKSFFTSHTSCFGEKAKQVVMIFGKLLDSGAIDEEGTEMLDVAMHDIISETNKLHECHRCFLCHQNLAARRPTEDDSSTTAAATAAAASTLGKKKLISSHMYPKAMLDRFASGVPLPKSKKIYDSLNPGLSSQFTGDQPQSAKESSYYMLCHCCEDLLSQHGENWFLTNFFDTLYDKTNPGRSRDEQVIPYTDKLYLFCAGIIFRTLSWGWNAYINSHECYKLLVQCRRCLLNHNLLSEITEKPDIYLLISPLAASQADLQGSFMNQVLSGTCTSNVACIDLETGVTSPKSSLKVHFLLVHMGMINLLVKFSPSSALGISSACLINPAGGCYHVPSENNRKKGIPKGVWAAFEHMAKDFEESWYAHQNKPYLLIEKQEKLVPNPDCADSFGILSGILKELSLQNLGPHPANSSGETKVVNLLPEFFYVRSPQFADKLVLPENHTLLLHHTFKTDTGGITLFLAVGCTGAFDIDKPYVVWHEFVPGMHTNFAFFVSIDDLKGTKLLSAGKEKYFTANPDSSLLFVMKDKAPKLLKILLHVNGFYSIRSLLYKIGSCKDTLPMVDKHCEDSCWYCCDKCTNCLNAANADYYSKKENCKPLKFCSKECQQLCMQSIGSENPTSAVIVSSDGKIFCLGSQTILPSLKPRCFPIAKSHSKVLHVFMLAENAKGFIVQKEMILCIGDGTEGITSGSKYIVHWSCTLHSQNFLEYHVDENYSPTHPLHYLANEPLVLKLLEAIKQNGDEQVVLERAMKVIQSTDRESMSEHSDIAAENISAI